MPDKNYINNNSAKNNESLRSKTVNEILAGSPGFLVKYGLQLFLCIFLSLFIILFFVQLPETINADVKIQNENIANTNQQQHFIEILLSANYKKDIHTGTQITVKFLDDITKKNNQITTVVTNISANAFNKKFLIKANLPVGVSVNNSVYENHFKQAEVSYNLKLLQHIYKNITPGI